MCPFQDEARVTVGDAAMGRVGAELDEAFPGAVGYTHLEGEGTHVEASPAVEHAQFDSLVRAALTAAQERSGEGGKASR